MIYVTKVYYVSIFKRASQYHNHWKHRFKSLFANNYSKPQEGILMTSIKGYYAKWISSLDSITENNELLLLEIFNIKTDRRIERRIKFLTTQITRKDQKKN